jgi:hypothetical protein
LITAGEHVWQLSEAGDNSLGLSCTAEGLFLGRTPLIERRGDGYFVRPQAELARLLGRAYGADIIPDRLMPGFAAVAGALGIKLDPLAEVRQAQWEAGIATLRRIDPNNLFRQSRCRPEPSGARPPQRRNRNRGRSKSNK